MHIGQSVIVRHQGEVKEGKVNKIFEETLEISLTSGETITRNFWEIRKIENEE